MKKDTTNFTDKDDLLYSYCNNDMAKLRQLCDYKIRKIGGISQMDYDDLYSIALDVLASSVKTYDPRLGKGFDSFLSGNIDKRFQGYIRTRNCLKRGGTRYEDSDGNRLYNYTVPLDSVTEGSCSLSEIIPSDYDLEVEIINRIDGINGTKIQIYLNKLSNLQRKIVGLLAQGYEPREISEYLHITKRDYASNMKGIRAYENVKVLY